MKRRVAPRHRMLHARMVVRARWHRVSSGGIFPSAVAAAAAVLLALLAQILESRYGSGWCDSSEMLQPLCSIPLDMSVSLQAGVGLGVLGTVGIVFSILLVSLQLISGQFSPRLVQAVFRDMRSKALIALLVGVFVFSMTSLFSTIVFAGRDGTSGFNTALVGTSGVIAGIALVTMLYGIAQRQYIGSILDQAANQTIAIIEEGASKRLEELRIPTDIPESAPKDITCFPRRLGPVYVVNARRSGWVQQLTSDALLHVAPNDCVIRLETRVGAFIPRGAPLASVWPLEGPSGCSHFTAEERRELDSSVNLTAYIGTARTLQDDADFGLRQITDVFLRAMSPAVNDPSTAIEALMRTTTVLRAVILNPLPDQIDEDRARNVVVLRPWDLDAEEYMRHGLDQVRLASVAQPSTAIALLRVLTHLIETADLELRDIEHIADAAERRARGQHVNLARVELLSQRDALRQAIQEAGYADRDLQYVLSGLKPQRPDMVGDYPPASLTAQPGRQLASAGA